MVFINDPLQNTMLVTIITVITVPKIFHTDQLSLKLVDFCYLQQEIRILSKKDVFI